MTTITISGDSNDTNLVLESAGSTITDGTVSSALATEKAASDAAAESALVASKQSLAQLFASTATHKTLYDSTYVVTDSSFDVAYNTYWQPKVEADPSTCIIVLHGVTLPKLAGPNMLDGEINLLVQPLDYTDASGFTSSHNIEGKGIGAIDIAQFCNKVQTKVIYAMAPGERTIVDISGAFKTDYLTPEVWLPQLLDQHNIGTTDKLVFMIISGGGGLFNIALPRLIELNYNIVEVNMCGNPLYYSPTPTDLTTLSEFAALIIVLNGIVYDMLDLGGAPTNWTQGVEMLAALQAAAGGATPEELLSSLGLMIMNNLYEIIDAIQPDLLMLIKNVDKYSEPYGPTAVHNILVAAFLDPNRTTSNGSTGVGQFYGSDPIINMNGNFSRIFKNIPMILPPKFSTMMDMGANSGAWTTLANNNTRFNIFHSDDDLTVNKVNTNQALFLTDIAGSTNVIEQPLPLSNKTPLNAHSTILIDAKNQIMAAHPGGANF